MTVAATTESSLFTDPNALGFLKGVAFGATILPFAYEFAVIDLDNAGDRTRLAPLRARGGRNRLIAVALMWEDMDTSALAADISIHMNGADTKLLTASAIFSTASAAGTLYWLIPQGGVILDDTAGDMEATLDFVVTTAGTAPIADAALWGFVIYE